jgi:tetratricopeptide (TPR) repeat protein
MQDFEAIESEILQNISRNPTKNFTESNNGAKGSSNGPPSSKLHLLPPGTRKTRLAALLQESRGNLNHNLYPASQTNISAPLKSQVASTSSTATSSKQQDPPSPDLIKAKIMNLYSRGDQIEESILLLLTYLEYWLSDHEAWLQLSLFYKELGLYSQALYALEEVLMLKSDDFLVMMEYADLLSALGDEAASLNYYCASLERVETARGWYGVLDTASRLNSTSSVVDKDTKSLVQLAKERIRAIYDQDVKGNSVSKYVALAYLDKFEI